MIKTSFLFQAIGNHEFDDGIDGIVPYLKSLKAPVLAANIDTSEEPSMDGLYRPHIVIKRKGRRIGIIGITTTEYKVCYFEKDFL